MTKEQHRRWLDFSSRLARHGYPEATDARKEKIRDMVEGFIKQYADICADVDGWDGNGQVYPCDDLGEWLCSHDIHMPQDASQVTRFESQVSACVRAGLDVAVEPSAGVVGFDVGTLRRMFDGAVPAWVMEWFEPPLTGREPDSEGVWL